MSQKKTELDSRSTHEREHGQKNSKPHSHRKPTLTAKLRPTNTTLNGQCNCLSIPWCHNIQLMRWWLLTGSHLFSRNTKPHLSGRLTTFSPADQLTVTLLHLRSLHHERRTVQEIGLLHWGHPPPEHDHYQLTPAYSLVKQIPSPAF